MEPFERFTTAQDPIFEHVRAELRAGRKKTHWMWFVFPQIAGLGRSPAAQKYALGSLAEAKAYLEHPALGERLRECTETVLKYAAKGRSAHQIFGSPDDLKFHSSMTLFHLAAPAENLFKEALESFFDGRLDSGTTARLDP